MNSEVKSDVRKTFDAAWQRLLVLNERATVAIDQIGHWKGFLNEAQFIRSYVTADKANDEARKQNLLMVQEARRVSYAGWKIAACVNLLSLKQALLESKARYAALSDDERLDEPYPLDTNAVTLLRNRDGTNGDTQYVEYLPATQRLVNLAADETDGNALAAIHAVYASFLRGENVHIWSSDFEPFPGNASRTPFTLIACDSSNPLLGADIANKYHELSADNWHQILTNATTGLADNNGDLVFPLEEAHTDRQIHQQLIRHNRRRIALRIRKQTEAAIRRLNEFSVDLNTFMNRHQTGGPPSGVENLSELEAAVAKYNFLAAFGLRTSIIERVSRLYEALDLPRKYDLERRPGLGVCDWWVDRTVAQLNQVHYALYGHWLNIHDPIVRLFGDAARNRELI